MNDQPIDHDLYDALLRPRIVAIVGASDNRAKTTARPLDYLLQSGWDGVVYPVNPTRRTVLGRESFPSVRDVPAIPDQVYVLTAADAAVEAAAECAELGVPVVSIMADGFVGTSSPGARRSAALREVIAGSGTRILGPSSLGVANLSEGLLLTANAAFAESALPRGDVFVASQSGSAIGALLSRGKAMGIGFHALVSTGGEIDLSLGEICLATVDDPAIASYALFMENLNAAGELRRFAQAAAARGKPIVAYKLGRSPAGAELAVSHTGALAGDDTVASALMRDLGIARVTNFESLLESQHLARSVPLPARPNPRPRVGVLSTTGGGGAMIVDCLAVAGAVPTAPAADTVARLAEHGIDAGHGVLIDLTLAGTQYAIMKAALDVVCTAPEYDAIVAVPGSSARFQPELAVQPIADSVGCPKPMVSFIMPAAPGALALLRRAGVSGFSTPESCAEALTAVFNRRTPADGPLPPPPVGISQVLDEQESYGLLAEAGLRHADFGVVETRLAGTPALRLPVPAPAVVKVLARQVPHKSDLGAVVLGIGNDAELDAAIKEIAASVGRLAPQVPVDRMLVQEMIRGVGEVLIGYRYDRDAGPIVLLAAGGVLAEVHQERSVRTAPVDLATARDMIAELASLRSMEGYRGAPRGDLEALAAAVAAVSKVGLASGGRVVEAEANPVIVLPEGRGVVAVDALVRLVAPEDGR